MEIKDRLVQLRNMANISQSKLAKGIGVSPGNVSDWELGRSKPGADALRNLSIFYRVSIDWIVMGVGEEGSIVENQHDKDSIHNQKSLDNEMYSIIDYDEEKNKKLKLVKIDEDEEQILTVYRSFSFDDKEFFKSMMAMRHNQIQDSLKKKEQSSDYRHGEITTSKEDSKKQMA